jgi:predicted nucleic acid-binding protein
MQQYRVFLDAGVYIAGAGSGLGGSRQILDWCAERLLQPVTSTQVLLEARRNVAKKLPRAVAILELIIHQVDAELLQEPTDEEIANAARVAPSKNVPILATASKANVEYFVTLDRKHFKQPKVLSAVSFQILLPEEFAPLIRAEMALEAE